MPPPLLGTRPACGWPSPAVLAVTLGAGATLLPGDLLVWDAPLADPTGALPAPRNQSAVVVAPAQPTLPRVTVAGPDSVAACDEATLTASATLAQGGTFDWGCPTDGGLDALLRNQTQGPVATVPGTLLSAGRAYFISVRVRNRFGDLSEAFLRPLRLATAPSVLLSIVLPSPPYTRGGTLRLEASASLSRYPPVL